MLRLSKLTDYGTLIMTHLARDPRGVHAANEIAVGVQLSLPTVTKVLKILARAGLLHSQRGTKGGYALARAPEQISVAEVVEALEGPIGLTECGVTPGSCAQEPSCSVRGNWQLISNAVLGALRGVTLAQMAHPTLPIAFSALPRSRQASAVAGQTGG
jgi:FeS assembly SUF system regulator